MTVGLFVEFHAGEIYFLLLCSIVKRTGQMPFSILDVWIQCFSRKNAVAKKSERDNVGICSKLCQFSCKTLLKSAQFVDTEWSCSPGYPGDLFGRGSCDLQKHETSYDML